METVTVILIPVLLCGILGLVINLKRKGLLELAAGMLIAGFFIWFIAYNSGYEWVGWVVGFIEVLWLVNKMSSYKLPQTDIQQKPKQIQQKPKRTQKKLKKKLKQKNNPGKKIQQTYKPQENIYSTQQKPSGMIITRSKDTSSKFNIPRAE